MIGGHLWKLYATAGVALAVAAPPRAGSAGVTVALPPGWHSTKPDQGAITNPLTRLVVSSGPIRPRLTGRCHTQVADYTFPPNAVAIVVVEWTKPIGGMKIGTGPKRPRRFTAANLPIHQPPDRRVLPGPGGSAQWAETRPTRSPPTSSSAGRRPPPSRSGRAQCSTRCAWRGDSRPIEGFRFHTDVAVRFAETDAQGIAHNAAYLVWFEVAADRVPGPLPRRLPLMQESGHEALTWSRTFAT